MGAAAKPPAEAVAIMAATRLLEPTVAVSSTLYLAGPPLQCHGMVKFYSLRALMHGKTQRYAAFATIARLESGNRAELEGLE